MRKTTALTIVILFLLSLFLTACGQGSSGDQVLIFGRGNDSVSLDPAVVTDGESLRVTQNIFESLVLYEEDSMRIRPGLAKEWTVSEDGLAYTFILQEGVKFHDGTDFNADAVVFNFKRWANPSDPMYANFEYYSGQFGGVIDDVIAVDPHTVRIELVRPLGPFLQNIAMQSFGIASPTAIEKHGSEKFGQNPVGTGPFKFVSWQQNDAITLEKYKDYRIKGEPKLDRLIFKSIPDNSARLNALKAGDIDMMDDLNPSDVKSVEADPNLQVFFRPSNNIGYLGFNVEKEPFNDPRVRVALSHAVNKQGILDTFYDGIGEVAKNPIPPSMWGYHDGIEDYPYDLELAKQLLADAGYPNGFKATFHAMTASRPYMPNGPKVAEAIQADFKKIGVELEILTPEWAVYLDETKDGKQDMYLLGWTGDNGDPDNFIYILLDQDNIDGSNRSRYANQELHDILIEAQTEADQAVRTELYMKAQEIIHNEAPWVPLVHSKPALAASKKIKDFVPHPGGTEIFYRVKIDNN